MRWSNSAAEPCPPPRWCSDGAAARRPGNGRRPRRQDRRSPACRSGHPILRPMLAAWQRHRDAGFVTRKDLRAVEVAAIGDGFEHLCLQNSLRLLGDIGKLCSIRAAVLRLGPQAVVNPIAKDRRRTLRHCYSAVSSKKGETVMNVAIGTNRFVQRK